MNTDEFETLDSLISILTKSKKMYKLLEQIYFETDSYTGKASLSKDSLRDLLDMFGFDDSE